MASRILQSISTQHILRWWHNEKLTTIHGRYAIEYFLLTYLFVIIIIIIMRGRIASMVVCWLNSRAAVGIEILIGIPMGMGMGTVGILWGF